MASPVPSGMYTPHAPTTSRRCAAAVTSVSRPGAAEDDQHEAQPLSGAGGQQPPRGSRGRARAGSSPRSRAVPAGTCRRNPRAWPSQPSRAPATAPITLTIERNQAAPAELSPNSSCSTGRAAAPLPICAAPTTPAATRARTAPQEVPSCRDRPPSDRARDRGRPPSAARRQHRHHQVRVERPPVCTTLRPTFTESACRA